MPITRKMETAGTEIEMNEYRSFPAEDEQRRRRKERPAPRRSTRYSVKHRGFRTSIIDLFEDPDHERIDCCSIACGGCLQADRNRFLVNGTRPPGLERRLCVHVAVPAGFFGIALVVAFGVPDRLTSNVLCYAWALVLVFYLLGQCDKGSWKRRDVRRNLLWAKHRKMTAAASAAGVSSYDDRDEAYREDSYDSYENDNNEECHLGQSASDVRNASACCCGFYAADRSSSSDNPEEGDYDDEYDHDHPVVVEVPLLAKAIRCMTAACCGLCCRRYLVCCGFCSVAQEGREIESLVRPGVLRIDYVTMEPVMSYYPAIYAARHGIKDDENENETAGCCSFNCGGGTWWWTRLSKLSRRILWNAAVAMTVLLAWSLSSDRLHHAFGVGNYAVLVLTLLQSILLLGAVWWNLAKNDVSLDALVKFFASGFCLSTTLAISFELVLGLMVRIAMAILMAASGIEAVEENGYATPTMTMTMTIATKEEDEDYSWNLRKPQNRHMMMDLVGYGGGSYRDYLTVYGNEHPVVYTLYLFVVSFLLAAAIEETCKYFGYRMVDHPDFYAAADLDEALACHDYDDDDEKDNDKDDDGIAPKQKKRTTTPIIDSFEEQDERSLRSRGSAITVAMVAVGVGFACCENLVYVFLYGRMQRASELGMLLVRSIVPVHPVAAALQSLRVRSRDLEGRRRSATTGLASIVGPGVVLHGAFDFALLWCDYAGSRKGRYVNDDDYSIETENGSDRVARILATTILAIGFLCYVRESARQNDRLTALDDHDDAARRGGRQRRGGGGGVEIDDVAPVPADSGWLG